MSNTRSVADIVADIIEPLVGNIPVSVQLATALNDTANEKDVSDLRADLNALRKEVERLVALVGDIPVSEQIAAAMNRQA